MTVRARLGSAVIVAVALVSGCGSDAKRTGKLIVGNSTFGTNPDADGYVVIIDGQRDRRIAVNLGDEWILPEGTHTVELGDIQSNCVIEDQTVNGAATGPNPQTVTVIAPSLGGEEFAEAWFAVMCR